MNRISEVAPQQWASESRLLNSWLNELLISIEKQSVPIWGYLYIMHFTHLFSFLKLQFNSCYFFAVVMELNDLFLQS